MKIVISSEKPRRHNHNYFDVTKTPFSNETKDDIYNEWSDSANQLWVSMNNYLKALTRLERSSYLRSTDTESAAPKSIYLIFGN